MSRRLADLSVTHPLAPMENRSKRQWIPVGVQWITTNGRAGATGISEQCGLSG